MSWQRLNPSWTCEGRKQSPINIKTSSVFQEQMTKNVVIKQHPPHLPLTGVFKNNGHSPTFTLTGPTSVRLLGGTLLNAYYLKQIHFHFGCSEETGSEHFINGVQYPLEVPKKLYLFLSIQIKLFTAQKLHCEILLFKLKTFWYHPITNNP